MLLSRFVTVVLCLSLLSGASHADTVTYAVLQVTMSSHSPQADSSGRSGGNFENQRFPKDLSNIKGVYAAFGSVLSFSGRLKKARPFDACGRIMPSMWDAKRPRTVLLVEHGGCNYTHKVRNLRLAGVDVMILKNRGEELRQMESEVPWPGFVAVMVKNSVGLQLKRCLEENRVVNMTISVGETRNEDEYGLINEKAFTVICVAFGLVIAFSMFGLSFFYVQRCRILEAERRRQKRLKRKAVKAVNQLPTRVCKGRTRLGSHVSTYNDTASTSSGLGTCVICLDDFCRGDLLRTLPCNHEFHKACIDPWLLDKRTCPMCKLDILKTLAVHDPQVTDPVNNCAESRSSTPLPSTPFPSTPLPSTPLPRSLSGSIRLDSDAVELGLVRSGSESRDPSNGSSTCDTVSIDRLSEVVAMAQVTTAMSGAAVEDDVFVDEMAHNTVIDMEIKPCNQTSETRSDDSSSQCGTDQLASDSSHTLTSQTSDHPYDSTVCLI